MQSQSNPLDGERRLGVTHCDRCGAQEPLNDEGYCQPCQKLILTAAIDVAEAVCDGLRAAIGSALEGNIHPDDLREMVEEEIGSKRGEKRLSQLYAELDVIYEATYGPRHTDADGRRDPLLEGLQRAVRGGVR